MKYCSKCGKELLDEAVICPGCGCAVQVNKSVNVAESYETAAQDAATTNIIGGIILAAGIVCALFLNVWIGAILCLVAELVLLAANTKIQKLFKTNNANITDKKEFKAASKKLKADLKEKYSAYKLSFILAYISFACLAVLLLFFV